MKLDTDRKKLRTIADEAHALVREYKGDQIVATRVEGGWEWDSEVYRSLSAVAKAVTGCDGVLTVLVPWGVQDYSSGSAQAVLERVVTPDYEFGRCCPTVLLRKR